MSVRNYKFKYMTNKAVLDKPFKARWRSPIVPDPDEPPISKTSLCVYFGVIALFAYILGAQKLGLIQAKLKDMAHIVAPTKTEARPRLPQIGDNWKSCEAARKAGTAPILAHEPGYRKSLDKDLNGIACEPYFGN